MDSSHVNTSSDRMKELRAQIQDLKRQAEVEAQKMFKEGAKELFANHPSLESFSWTQYTPAFCDGDPCYFSAHTDYPKINEQDSWELRDNVEMAPVVEAVERFLNLFTDDDMEALFGDHAKVTTTRSGVEVDEYDHE